jgi:hypothetical protein
MTCLALFDHILLNGLVMRSPGGTVTIWVGRSPLKLSDKHVDLVLADPPWVSMELELEKQEKAAPLLPSGTALRRIFLSA